jgi:acetyl-CoA acetyltransferase family protein
MESISEAATRIQRHEARAGLAGGAESMSTIPLLFPDETLEPVGQLMKAKSLRRRMAAMTSFRPRHFKPRAALELGLTDPTCGMIMGKTAEVLAHEFGVPRSEQDEFALQSHRRTVEAAEAGRFDEQLVPVYAGQRFDAVGRDVGPRENQTIDALGKLKPIFDRRDGSVTVGNSCQVTDGAAAMLVMNPELARAEGLETLGTVRGYATAGLDPARMGLGPVFAIDQLLKNTGVALSDLGLFEINEAFAAQVLACLKAIDSDRFARRHLDRDRAIGSIDPDRLNVNGGAIALGHPVGASGARLVLNLLYEMRRRDVELGMAALCVGGGQGAAILLQRS